MFSSTKTWICLPRAPSEDKKWKIKSNVLIWTWLSDESSGPLMASANKTLKEGRSSPSSVISMELSPSSKLMLHMSLHMHLQEILSEPGSSRVLGKYN
ncbi:hypothetical protein Patl1_34956 [Pistacia atlantica]|uniref:Uncharacterized protein n=1 Tax=Pistacia atlantica TaxID=434234 RepID=A0ACC0ZRR7_9ROSI|nr:hypothetical protein Patl1_34956 [Pistacia atlantica]